MSLSGWRRIGFVYLLFTVIVCSKVVSEQVEFFGMEDMVVVTNMERCNIAREIIDALPVKVTDVHHRYINPHSVHIYCTFIRYI